MAGGKIRGITLEIGGDTSGLSKSLKEVNGDLKDTQKQLKDVDKLLKLDPKNTELLRQKQELLAKAIEQTETKLDTLKKAQETMDQNGIDKNSDQYMALQREIIETERSMTDLKNAAEKIPTAAEKAQAALKKVGDTADKVAKGAKNVADKTRALSAAAGGLLTAIGGAAYKAVTAADDLNALAQQTGFTTAELQKMQYASAVVDVDFQTMTAAAAKLTKQLGSNEKKITALGVKTRKADGSFKDVNEIFYNTLNALAKIENETERDVAAMDIFGKSANELAGIIDDGGAALKELGNEAESLGLILSQETLDSLNETNDQLDKMKAQAQQAFIEFGATAMEALLPALELVLDKVGQLLQWLGSLNSEQLQAIITVLAVVAAISPLASMISGVATAVKGVSAAISFLIANPIVALIAAIVGLVILIGTKGDEIKAKLQGLDDWLQGVFARDWTETFGPVLGGVLNRFFDTVKTIWDAVKKIFDGLIDFIRGVFTGDWERAWNGIKEILGGVWDLMVGVIKSPINRIISMVNFMIDAINSAIGAINKIHVNIPDWVPKIGGSSFGFNIGSIGHIPMLANGGVLTSGSAIVGEAGAEMLTMQGGKAVVRPLNMTGVESLLGGISDKIGNGNVQIVVQSVLDGRVIGESVTSYQRSRARAYGM